VIRPATRADASSLVQLVRDLAEYERSAGAVDLDEDLLAAALFVESPAVFAHVAEEAGEVVGMAIWFRNFSTWTGRHGIYLEDLFVRPAWRGRGVGRALLAALASVAVEAGYARLDWSVLDWNEPALAFYRSLGAVPMDEWTGYRLTGDALREVAAESGQDPVRS
jgi:GNAT superfamily N-acetyltransferase